MLIGYDGRFITRRPTGNGIYAIRLIEALSSLDYSNQYRIYIPGPNPAIPVGLGENAEVRIMNYLHRSAWLRVPILFPLELRRFPVDIFHAHYTIPPWTRTEVVMTLHDFFWIVYPQHFVSIKRIPITYTIRKSVTRADRILVGSSHTKQQAIEYFKVPEDRFAIIPYGLDQRFLLQADEEELMKIRRKYGIDAPYILAVGDIHPRKNLERLLKAFTILPERRDVKLVLVGKPLWKSRELYQHIENADLEDSVITTGYVPDDDLPLLYQAAEIFCYPSLYEGFGFPIIEAMASGVPVATSDTTSCPEVGGEAAVYFNPTSVEDIADKLSQILTDSEFRDECIRAGFQWARRFTWEETAARTMEIYHSLQ
jgi:glycosyltransferase involved in cell wall biosynthesis